MNTNEIRSQFLRFFQSKGHRVVPSAPMVVKNDPTLMFINAGMNPFKDYFLGYTTPKERRLVNTQKCLRVSGKHNDLEEVGVDTYHHTMFEMLGNWSFGDYFKEEAIAWAWELCIDVFQLDSDRIYITVFGGDEEDQLEEDSASTRIWSKYIDPDRIVKAGKKDNFWEMGDTGPCGPCSEVHIDIRTAAERNRIDGKTLVNQGHPQVIEIWNLVFMQFHRKADRQLEDLPQKHVDTGMGLERLAMVIQAKQSNYDTDLFQALIRPLEAICGKPYGTEEATDIALRVVSDHLRAIAFSIADGQLPSNTGAGYVIRRILRRAVRYGYQSLHIRQPFIHQLTERLVALMGEPFPELKANQSLIQHVIEEEEKTFFKTLETGLGKITALMETARAKGEKQLTGKAVFELYDTFGFPLDLTALIAKEHQLGIDTTEFQIALTAQKERSRSATLMTSDDWIHLVDDEVEEFVGYDLLSTDVRITKYRKVHQKKQTLYQLVFNITPFYAEGGGQVGDQGWIEAAGEKIEIIDTKKENNLIVHFCRKLPQQLQTSFKASVNTTKRQLTQANHSATHLLHHALREVLGVHVTQRGSLVKDTHLRFDFAHFSKVSAEELTEVEDKVNAMIRDNIPLKEQRAVPLSVAEGLGAMALFGEKYGDLVRIVQFGNSIELCGGTHVQSTGQIYRLKITSEGAVAAGVRRIEAITSSTAETYFAQRMVQFEAVSELLKKPKDLTAAVQTLIESHRQLTKEMDQLKRAYIKGVKAKVKARMVTKDGINYVADTLDLDAESIKSLCFQLKGEVDRLLAVFGGKANGKVSLTVLISEDVVQERALHAGKLVKTAADYIRGGGGGQPFFATAGGKEADGLPKAMQSVEQRVFGEQPNHAH